MWFDKIASCGADLIKWVLKFKKVKRSQNSYLQGLVFLKLTGIIRHNEQTLLVILIKILKSVLSNILWDSFSHLFV